MNFLLQLKLAVVKTVITQQWWSHMWVADAVGLITRSEDKSLFFLSQKLVKKLCLSSPPISKCLRIRGESNVNSFKAVAYATDIAVLCSA